jgi:predicted dehydrogenase
MSEPSPSTSSRRHFLKTAAAGVAAFNIVPRHVLGGPGFVPPSEKVNVALVGAGGQGRVNLRQLLQLDDVQVIAVADAAESFSLENFYYKGTGGRLPTKADIEKHYQEKTPNFRCAEYEDFRVMLDKEKEVDAVLCATPDHLHAYISCYAMRAGKHVYCEKPLAHNIWETRHVAKVMKETGRATLLGSQGHSSLGTRETVEYIQSGAIGTVREIHSWVGAKRWNPTLTGRPTDTPPVPAGLNWDLWLGPRTERPFHPAYFPVAWRDFWDFGTTGIGDFGCHDLNTAVRAFNLPLPSRVEAFAAGIMDQDIAPHGSMIHYDFPATDKNPAIHLTWYDGGLKPQKPEALGAFPLPRRGTLYIGDKGVIQCDGSGGPPRLFPDSLRASFKKPEPWLKRSEGHHRDWINACKGGPAASSPFDYAAHLTEIVLLGVLSLRSGKVIEWDGELMQAKGQPNLEPFIRESYRKGWEVV